MIIRKIKNNNYTSISNFIIKDKNVSLQAKGLLLTCLALPDDWDFNKQGLMTITNSKRPTINSAIKELKDNKYLYIEKILPNKTENGRLDYKWYVFEEPYKTLKDINKTRSEKQDTEKQDTEKQDTEKQDTENLQLLNTNNIKYLNNQILKNKNIYTPIKSLPAELRGLMKEFVDNRIELKQKITEKAVQMLCKKVMTFPEDKRKQVIENSIMYGWKGLFLPKDEKLDEEYKKARIKEIEKKTQSDVDRVYEEAQKLKGKLYDTGRSKSNGASNQNLLPTH